MILYHGSDVEVKTPVIIKSEKGRDFGFGFYLTPIKEQAERMARRKQRINRSDKAVVSVYEWNEDKESIAYKHFPSPNEEWLDFIIKCRTDISFNHGFDVVEGRIADDAVGEVAGDERVVEFSPSVVSIEGVVNAMVKGCGIDEVKAKVGLFVGAGGQA